MGFVHKICNFKMSAEENCLENPQVYSILLNFVFAKYIYSLPSVILSLLSIHFSYCLYETGS